MPKEPIIYEHNGLDEPAQTDPNDSGILWASRVDALQRERAAYDKRGLGDRVEAVDAELERLGYRAGAGNVAEDARSLPVAETSRALPKETADPAPADEPPPVDPPSRYETEQAQAASDAASNDDDASAS